MATLEDIFKSLVWDNLTRAALTALFAAAPYLAWWPLSMVITMIVTGISNKLFAVLKLTVNLEVISFKNLAHQKAYDDAAVKLKVLAIDHGADSPEYLKARESAKADFSQYVRFGSLTVGV